MNRFFQKIDGLIEKIPAHIKDIIQKGAIATGAIGALFSITLAVIQGIKDADRGGFQIVEKSDDLFYLNRLKEENSKKVELIEDIDHDIMSLIEKNIEGMNNYRPLARDTLDHLIGEKDDLLLNKNKLREQNTVPSFINDELVLPKIDLNQKNKTPDDMKFPSTSSEKNFLKDDPYPLDPGKNNTDQGARKHLPGTPHKKEKKSIGSLDFLD